MSPAASTKRKEVEVAEDPNATPLPIQVPPGHPMSKMLKYGGGGVGLAMVVSWLFMEGVVLTKEQRKAEYDTLRFQIIEEIRREQQPMMQKLDEVGSRMERVETRLESGVVTRDQFSTWIYERGRENRDKGIDWGTVPMSGRDTTSRRPPS